MIRVDAHKLDLDRVAETIDLAAILAAKLVLPLEEFVIVIGHARDVDEPFDKMFHQLDE